MSAQNQLNNAQAALDLALEKLEELKRHHDPDVAFRARYALGQLRAAVLLIRSAARRMYFH